MLRLCYQGKTHKTIAETLNVSIATVSQRLPQLIDAELKRNQHLISREILIQNGILTKMLEAALTQFHKSTEAGIEVERIDEGSAGDPNGFDVVDGQPTTDKQGNEKGSGRKRTVKTKKTTNYGDPRFLSEARAIMADKRKLFGLDKEENRSAVINNYFNQTNVTVAQGNDQLLSVEEAAEMADIMKSLGLGVGGIPIANHHKQAVMLEAPADDDVIDAEIADTPDIDREEGE